MDTDKKPTVLQILRKRKYLPQLQDVNSHEVQTARAAMYRFTPEAFALLLVNLTIKAIIAFGMKFHFRGWTRAASWPQQVADSNDLASLPPAVLMSNPTPMEDAVAYLDTRVKLTAHVVGLLSRPAAANPDLVVYKAFMHETLKLVGVDLEPHIDNLWRLRQVCPAAFAAALDDRCDAALSIIQALNNVGERARFKSTIVDHFLLNRVFRLQRGIAYFASLTRAELMKIGKGRVDHRTVTSNSIRAVMGTFATASRDGLDGFIRTQAEGGKAGSPGRLSRPELFAKTVSLDWEIDVGAKAVEQFTTVLDPNATSVRGMIDYFYHMPDEPIAETMAARSHLHAKAGIDPPQEDDLRLMHCWTRGYPAGVMILAMVRCLAEVTYLVRNYPLLLHKCTSGKGGPPAGYKISVADEMKIADEFAKQIMGEYIPAFPRPDRENKLVAVALARRAEVMKSNSLGPEHGFWAAFDPASSYGERGMLYPRLYG